MRYDETPGVGLSRQVKPVSLAPLRLDDIPDHVVEEEAREAQARIIERRTIREGLDCWQQIGKTASLPAWYKIGRALAVGKSHALKVTGANAAWGQNYSREFGSWMRQHGFGTMPKATRSWAVALHENAASIEQWRLGLSERERKRLINPQSVVRRWQRETQQAVEQRHSDVATALAAWRCFVARAKALPLDQQALIWRAVSAEAAAHV